MKITYIVPALFIGTLALSAVAPTTASALSCLSPTEHIPMIVAEAEQDIFSGEIVAARETDGNVTELDVVVSEVLLGEAEDIVTLQYEYNETWAYLCTNEPGKVGQTETFIVRMDEEGVPYVTYSFAADSWFDEILSDALAESTTPPVVSPEPTELEEDRNLMLEVIDLLKELLNLLLAR